MFTFWAELGITLKTARGRGGEVSGIVYRRIKGNNVGGAAIQLNTGYGANTPHLPPTNKTGAIWAALSLMLTTSFLIRALASCSCVLSHGTHPHWGISLLIFRRFLLIPTLASC